VKYKYAVLEGDAVLLGEYEAWTYTAGKWQEMSNADAFTKAMLLSHGTFLNMFGSIEHQLPPDAFTATES
jgi:hypothetical protein